MEPKPAEATITNTCTNHSGNGIRTRVPALRGLCPSPLDDTAGASRQSARLRRTFYFQSQSRFAIAPFSVRPTDESIDSEALRLQARRESNPQPPVLETGALPIELRTSGERRSDAARQCDSG